MFTGCWPGYTASLRPKMNKTNETYSEFEQEIQAAMFVPDVEAEFVDDLRRQVKGKGRPKGPVRRGFFLRPVWAGAMATLILVIVVLLSAGPQRAWAAVQSLFGYVPGVGFVANDQPLRILEAPVVMERDGITLTVKEGLADADRTTIVYTVEGIRREQRPVSEAGPTCSTSDRLHLEDGALLDLTGGRGNGWPSGYESHAVFSPLPAEAEKVTLVISCLLDTAPDSAPENWQIELRFVPAPPNYQVLPVTEFSTPAVSTAEMGVRVPEATTVTPAIKPETENPLEGALVVERMVELEDGYLFQGAFSWKDTGQGNINFDSYRLEVYDANGQRVPAEPDFDSLPETNSLTDTNRPWALRINSKVLATPLTISLPSLEVSKAVQEQFEIDLGSSPQPGLTLDLNRDISLEGSSVRILNVALGSDRDGNYSLTFNMQIDTSVFTSISLTDPDVTRPGGGGGGGGGGAADGLFTQTILYPSVPQGVRHITINRVSKLISGPWIAQIDLPAGQSAVTPDQPQACLNLTSWGEIKAIPISSAPEGSKQGVLVEGPAKAGMTFPTMYVVYSDGRPAVEVGPGGWGALSPDGTRVAYVNSEGLQLADVATGQVTHLDWASENAYHPVWSPDGQQIAFVNGVDGISTSPLDGSVMQQVPGTSSDSTLYGWLPDGRHLILGKLGAEGTLIQAVDITRGQAEPLFTLDSRKGGSALISPDGQSIVFIEKVFGLTAVGAYTAHLDGSGRRLAVQAEAVDLHLAGWTTDGQGIFLFVEDPQYKEQSQVFLLRLETCEVIHLRGAGAE